MQPTTPTARLALDTIYQRPTKGIPSWLINPMEHSIIERLAGAQPGDYVKRPREVYRDMQIAVGTCLMDQWIPENPLSMSERGYEGGSHGATTGADEIIVDGMLVDSPEAAVEHMERFVFPKLAQAIREFDEEARVRQIIEHERAVQDEIGPTMLKNPYGVISFPGFAYGTYGYVNYFSAYALYPDIIERHFSLQADLATRNNRAAARAIAEGDLPPLVRLDHDMADSRGTLVRIESLDRIWFPHFARSIEPCLKAGIKMIWHCDGNLMEMVPRLLDCGLVGFQGFQYEDGMDYERICKMKTRDGDSLIIIAGVSVTRTLPMGTPADVKRELDWLVEYGPQTGLFLGASSSIAPGVPWENIKTMVEGFRYYREHGRV
ncbi:MAG: uroporphyrinogen decarboxylase family protein [Armatimonadota bacterium]